MLGARDSNAGTAAVVVCVYAVQPESMNRRLAMPPLFASGGGRSRRALVIPTVDVTDYDDEDDDDDDVEEEDEEEDECESSRPLRLRCFAKCNLRSRVGFKKRRAFVVVMFLLGWLATKR